MPDLDAAEEFVLATWRCLDSTFVMQNQITTPFFVRMGLVDQSNGPQSSTRGRQVPMGSGPGPGPNGVRLDRQPVRSRFSSTRFSCSFPSSSKYAVPMSSNAWRA